MLEQVGLANISKLSRTTNWWIVRDLWKNQNGEQKVINEKQNGEQGGIAGDEVDHKGT